MKKTTLFALSFFVACQVQANTRFYVPSNPQKVKGVAKLAGSAGMLAYSLMTLKNGYINFRASRLSKPGSFRWGGFKNWIPIPSLSKPTASQPEKLNLSKYQFGTTGLCALLAKQLYDSGRQDLS